MTTGTHSALIFSGQHIICIDSINKHFYRFSVRENSIIHYDVPVMVLDVHLGVHMCVSVCRMGLWLAAITTWNELSQMFSHFLFQRACGSHLSLARRYLTKKDLPTRGQTTNKFSATRFRII